MLRYTAWAEVDLSAIAHNYREIRKRIGKKTKLCAVIKADAYGHGAVAVARIALDEGADYLAVATLSEALKLRAAGFTTPLLILGLIGAESASEIVYDNITQTVCQMD
ncbi:alanine racemase, partial [Selenomonas sp.]